MNDTQSKYELQAIEFLKTHNLSMLIAESKIQDAPTWCENGKHGTKYDVRIIGTEFRTVYGGTPIEDCRTLDFPFWNSLHAKQEGSRPTEYDILACISSDANAPTTADEVYQEFGDMLPSKCEAVARFARELQSFFTPSELDALGAIQ